MTGPVTVSVRSCLCLAALAGCAHLRPAPLPERVPEGRPVPKHPELRAGFGRADITPPPGPGLTGNGPEGKQSRGWRTRLYARALYLQDADGERLAIITADLPHISAKLHRLTAESLATWPDSQRIGADHLIISATHDHSAPGHFYEAAELNETASSVAGYDPALADRIVHGFLEALRQAKSDPARPGPPGARRRCGAIRATGATRLSARTLRAGPGTRLPQDSIRPSRRSTRSGRCCEWISGTAAGSGGRPGPIACSRSMAPATPPRTTSGTPTFRG